MVVGFIVLIFNYNVMLFGKMFFLSIRIFLFFKNVRRVVGVGDGRRKKEGKGREGREKRCWEFCGVKF